MKIEVLYFDGCPSHRSTVERVKEALRQEGLSAEIVEIGVQDNATAQSVGFLGSPTVRIDGVDVEPSARNSKEFGMMCRTYSAGSGRLGVPTQEMIQTALREAAAHQLRAHDCCEIPAKAPERLEEPRPHRERLLVGASVAAATGASLCCVIPIAAAVTGLGTITAGAVFETWRPYLLGMTALLLGAGFYLAYRDYNRACAPGSLCATKPVSRWSFGALALVAGAVVALAAFPYYSGPVAQVVLGQPASHPASSVALTAVTFRIPNMDCPACAVALSATLHKLPGVGAVRTDVDSREAVVSYDPAMQNVEALENIIIEAGFRIDAGTRS